MEYLIGLITTLNKTKSIIISAKNCQEAADNAKEKYPDYDVGRISSDEQEISYFKTMKLWKNSI